MLALRMCLLDLDAMVRRSAKLKAQELPPHSLGSQHAQNHFMSIGAERRVRCSVARRTAGCSILSASSCFCAELTLTLKGGPVNRSVRNASLSVRH